MNLGHVLKVCDDGILIQLLCFWTLLAYLFLFKTHNVLETGFCLYLQVEPTHLGPINGASPCLQRGKEIGTSSINWAQLSRFHLKTDRIQSPKRVLNKNRIVDNVQKHNNCIEDSRRISMTEIANEIY
jgi:hypothetical protein